MWLTKFGWILSPTYDLLNVRIILPKDDEDTALLFGGKKKNFNKLYFDRFGSTLNLNPKQINITYRNLNSWLPKAIELIGISFLEQDLKSQYQELITKRTKLFVGL
ncbi:hypothetical protein FLACOL7796_00813 [Flavobacterium collinsii]|uniref:HipA N-terminal subdomain 1 domain-containing protein n=2 Tax=Flavobacterium collinsii TaxID=1114861 RepID=A0ABN7EFU8_9FLAO|nr:hypothetical protein FLACOL7796_00813 [Flavobacterium collinsii]